MSGAGKARPVRSAVVRRLGTPARTEGSVNEPREREELGWRFNERWVYRWPVGDPAGEIAERVVYWRRYDFVGTAVRRGPEDTLERDESLLAALEERPEETFSYVSSEDRRPSPAPYYPVS